VSVAADVRLRDFLVAYLGDWPEKDGLAVIGSPIRRRPGWDGEVHEVVGVAEGDGGVLSVPPEAEATVREAVRTWTEVRTRLPKVMGRPKARVYSGTFRWTMKPADLTDAGEWVPFEDPRVPEWLKPFGGQTLIAFDDDGEYAAGVGIKRHNAAGMEISVGTEPASRGKGLASRLVAQAARWILAEGADAAGLVRSIPTAKAMADGLLVYAANGEVLRPSQGYPLRLLLPGFEGNMNIKWLRRLKVGTEPWHTRWDTPYYGDLMPDGTAREFTFVMEAKSVITSPSGGQTLPGPGFVEIAGLAWSGRGRVTQVDVSTDGGQSWAAATLQEPVLPMAWTRFRFPWQWDGHATHIQSRTIDETDYVQPSIAQLVEARGVNSFYHNNAIKTWAIAAGGEVTNVYA